MTTIAKECIGLFIKNPPENGLTRGGQMEPTQITLALLEAESVVLWFERYREGATA